MQHKSYNSFSFDYDEDQMRTTLVVPWDRFTAIGLAVSIAISLLILLLFIGSSHNEKNRYIEIGTVPTVLLNFGMGDGTGKSSGNLTEEGSKKRGDTPPTNLHDASTATSTASSDNTSSSTLEESNNVVAVTTLPGETTQVGASNGDAPNTIGSADGTWGGSGLGKRGTGKGKGYGFGDIDWGGGGNRWLVGNKILPKFPKGVKISGTIKLKFYVHPDGTVGKIIPIQKADPRLERAAMEALKRWRFNPIKGNTIMVGIIPLTFKLT